MDRERNPGDCVRRLRRAPAVRPHGSSDRCAARGGGRHGHRNVMVSDGGQHARRADCGQDPGRHDGAEADAAGHRGDRRRAGVQRGSLRDSRTRAGVVAAILGDAVPGDDVHAVRLCGTRSGDGAGWRREGTRQDDSARDHRRHARDRRDLRALDRRRDEPGRARPAGEVHRAVCGRGAGDGWQHPRPARRSGRRHFGVRIAQRLDSRREPAADGGRQRRPVPTRVRALVSARRSGDGHADRGCPELAADHPELLAVGHAGGSVLEVAGAFDSGHADSVLRSARSRYSFLADGAPRQSAPAPRPSRLSRSSIRWCAFTGRARRPCSWASCSS